MTEEKSKKKGFLGKVAKGAGNAVSGAAETAKNQAKAKATEYVVNQAKKNAEKKIDDMKNKLFNKKDKK